MELTPKVIDILLNAEGKALATEGRHGINVVPVSTIRVVDGKVLLMNYFFRKTLDNLLEKPRAALACWRGLEGYQIKGSTVYVESGEAFEEACVWIERNVPNRVLRGLLILTPHEVHNISPGAN